MMDEVVMLSQGAGYGLITALALSFGLNIFLIIRGKKKQVPKDG